MGGDSESASKNTLIPILKYRKYSNIRIFENLLASELVLAHLANGAISAIGATKWRHWISIGANGDGENGANGAPGPIAIGANGDRNWRQW